MMAPLQPLETFPAQTVAPAGADEKAAPTAAVESKKSKTWPPKKPSESLSEYAASRGYLSVTDLVSLAWCEVQSLYGVLGGRSLPLDQRPTHFTTKAGTVIVPDRGIAVEREKTLEKGRAIHAELEKELYAEQIVIPTETPADKWALRILEVCCGLKNLLNDGICREVRVFGIIEGFLVFGQVDEIELKRLRCKSDDLEGDEHLQTPTKASWTSQEEWRKEQARKQSAKRHVTLSPSETRKTRTIDAFFGHSQDKSQKGPFTTAYKGASKKKDGIATAAESEQEPLQKRPAFLVVSDSKTRFSPTVPRVESQTSAKLQCMLYRRMLEELCEGAVQYAAKQRRNLSESRIEAAASVQNAGLSFKACDVAAFLKSKRLDLHNALSDAFIAASIEWCISIGLFLDKGSDSNITPRLNTIHALLLSLADMVAQVKQVVTTSTLFGEELGITYRHRATFKRKKTEVSFTRSQKTMPENSLPDPSTSQRKDDPSPTSETATSSTVPVTPQRQKVQPRKKEASEVQSSRVEAAAVQQDLEEGLDERASLDLRNEREAKVSADTGVLSSPVKASQQALMVSPATPRKTRSQMARTPTSALPLTSAAPPEQASVPSTPSTPYQLEQQIIAKVAFQYDGAQLDAHLATVMPVWLGTREPIGVLEAETYKCNSCEYRADCEWRSTKAAEAWARTRAKRQAEEEQKLWAESGPTLLGESQSQDDADFLDALEKLERARTGMAGPSRPCLSMIGRSLPASRSSSGALIPGVASVMLDATDIKSPGTPASVHENDSDAEFWGDSADLPDAETLEQIESQHMSVLERRAKQTVADVVGPAQPEAHREAMPSSEAELWKGMLDDEALATAPSQ